MWSQIIKKLQNPETLLSFVLGVAVVFIAGMLLVNAIRNKTTNSVLTDQQSGPVGITTSGFKANVELPSKHTVKDGEDLWTIASYYYHSGYNWVTIAQNNNLVNPDVLTTGQELNIPKADSIYPEGNLNGNGVSSLKEEYTVEANDNLWNISCRTYSNCYRWTEIAVANNIANPDVIEIGQVLKLPK